jgi:hypothetical protein
MEQPICGLVETRHYHGLIQLKIGIVRKVLVQIFYIEFQQYLRKGLWYKQKSPYMNLGKAGFIVDQYG